jgi:hypothetical protein
MDDGQHGRDWVGTPKRNAESNLSLILMVPRAGTRIVSKNNALLIGGILFRSIYLKSLSAKCPTDF